MLGGHGTYVPNMLGRLRVNKLVIITDKTGRTIRKNFFLDNMKLDIGQIFRARFYIVR